MHGVDDGFFSPAGSSGSFFFQCGFFHRASMMASFLGLLLPDPSSFNVGSSTSCSSSVDNTDKGSSCSGTCPNCGHRYVGSRNQAVTCNRCRGMVWQPRPDFSKVAEMNPTLLT